MKINSQIEDLNPAIIEYVQRGKFYCICDGWRLGSADVQEHRTSQNCLSIIEDVEPDDIISRKDGISLVRALRSGNCFKTQEEALRFIDDVTAFARKHAIKDFNEDQMYDDFTHRAFKTICLLNNSQGKCIFGSGLISGLGYPGMHSFENSTFAYKRLMRWHFEMGFLFKDGEEIEKVVNYANKKMTEHKNAFLYPPQENRKESYYDEYKAFISDSDAERKILPMAMIAKENDEALRCVLEYTNEHCNRWEIDYFFKSWVDLGKSKGISIYTPISFDIPLEPNYHAGDNYSCCANLTLKEEDATLLLALVKVYENEYKWCKDISGFKEAVVEACPHLLQEIEQAVQAETEAYASKLARDFDKLPIELPEEITENWFAAVVMYVIELRFKNSEQIDPDFLLSYLEDYIYPDEKEYADTAEYEEAIEQFGHSSLDKRQMIKRKGAKATIKRVLEHRDEEIQNLQNFIDCPNASYDMEEVFYKLWQALTSSI